LTVVKHRPLPALAALAVLWALCAPAAFAQPSAADLERAFALLHQAAAARAPKGARIEVLPGTPDPRLKLAECARAEPQLAVAAPLWGRTRIGLRCVQGPVAWSVQWPVTVQVWAAAPVPRTALAAGTVLAENDLVSAVADWAAGATPPLTDPADWIGRTLARPVPAGQALRAADLRARQWFASGEAVRVLAQGPGFVVSATGRALSPGIEGQPVRVITDDGRTLVGRAVGERRVEVAL
jgi:flagellar basal body P-ring formation protein FlgA